MDWRKVFFDIASDPLSPDIDVDIVCKIKNIKLPDRLFKYRAFNSCSIKNLKEDTVWAAHPNTFNDPYDCHISIDLLSTVIDYHEYIPDEFFPKDYLTNLISGSLGPSIEEIRSHANTDPVFQDLLQAVYEQELMYKDMHNVCCFSENNSSIPMWSHYSDNHRGFCIEYNINNCDDDELKDSMFPCVYQKSPFNATEIFMKAFPDKNLMSFYLATLVKSTDWEYEKEWRLVLMADKNKPTGRAFGMPKPVAIYLGSRITDENEAEIREICQSKNIPLYKMKHSRELFEMNAIAINY